jgi:outer membrane protein OmpA-like peptidoglycan-associated protein
MKIAQLFLIMLTCSFYNSYGQVGTGLPIIEDFERDTAWIWSPWIECEIPNISSLNKGCAHSGKLGLNCSQEYFVRTDLQIGFPGQVISFWVRFQRKTNAYLGFGKNSIRMGHGYYLCLAPERNTFDIRRSPDYTYPFLKSASQTYKLHSWYRAELTFNTSTNVTAKLYGSNGTTLLNSITLEIPDLTPGGISFRGNYCHVDEIRGGSKQVIEDTSFAPKLGVPLLLNNIVFEVNNSQLLSQSFVELNKLVAYLKLNPTYKINIVGHTDNIGKEDDNKNLSDARAKAVADYLIIRGINKANISYLGFGSLKPIITNSTEEGRQKNRRVEITISGN